MFPEDRPEGTRQIEGRPQSLINLARGPPRGSVSPGGMEDLSKR